MIGSLDCATYPGAVGFKSKIIPLTGDLIDKYFKLTFT